MRNTILILLVCLFFIGCKKDGPYSSTPSLKYKSVDTKYLAPGGIIKFTLSFTDAEGDLDSLYVEKVNPKCALSGSIERFYVSDALVHLKSKSDDLLVSFGFRVSGYTPIKEPQCQKNDTCYYRFALLDKAKHHSDTVRSETVVIQYQ